MRGGGGVWEETRDWTVERGPCWQACSKEGMKASSRSMASFSQGSRGRSS